MFERHKQKIRSAYACRAKIMAASLTQQSERSGGIFTYHATKQPCVHTHILLDKKVSLPQMMARLKKQSILLDPIDKHYLSFFPKEKIVKLNVSNVKEEDIERGIEQMVEELKRVL
ncbi:hypothetical protein [Aneurinibacillus uraniidurans]|uniref:hypothetical protein n=1 Tax=Aneurinibacillus uraniidurans TaxID=2966586 RepID=UPI00234A80B1|nr:hypothetical protein [Aneurinibacillus sp. B1]WCN37913.1 hypothetical protein PO771_00290 [Aneurinibacillus sp. B1]